MSSDREAAPLGLPRIETSVSQTSRLWAVLVANLVLVGALVGVGAVAHSLGVWAEGADYLGDAATIGVSLLAVRLSSRAPTPKHPYGYPRATRCAAAINGGWLLLLSLLVAAGGVERLIAGVHRVHGLPVLMVSAVAAIVMLGGAVLLGTSLDDGDRNGGLHVRAVLLDTGADAAAAAGVAVTGAVIYATHGLYWLDPAVALGIAVVVGYHAVQLLARARTALAR